MRNYLKNERERLGLVQSEIAEKCSVTIRTVVNWEKGSPIPSDKLAIMASLGFDIQYVVSGTRSCLPDSAHLSEEERGILEKAIKILKRVCTVFF